MNDLELLKYPIGRFKMPERISDEDLQEYIRLLENLPIELGNTIENFDDKKLNTPYRENGWTVEQVVTHIADSHSRAYAMFKQGLKQNNINAITYSEKKVLDLGENKKSIMQQALHIISVSHESWVSDLKALSESELNLTFFYPDAGRQMPLSEFLAIFSWHSKHHLAHIKSLKDRMGW